MRSQKYSDGFIKLMYIKKKPSPQEWRELQVHLLAGSNMSDDLTETSELTLELQCDSSSKDTVICSVTGVPGRHSSPTSYTLLTLDFLRGVERVGGWAGRGDTPSVS